MDDEDDDADGEESETSSMGFDDGRSKNPKYREEDRMFINLGVKVEGAPGHTVVCLPYYPTNLKEKMISKLIQSRLSEVPKGASILQTLPKILTPGHKWPSRPFGGSKNSVFYKVKRSSGLLGSLQ